jgi:outer membrane protein TolC
MGSYTLFNSFKDKLAYDVAKMSYERSKQNFKETVRSVKSQVVTAYFLAKTEQDKLDVAQRSLEMARALLRLVKSRSHVGRATASDVSSAEMDVLTAQNSVNQFVGSEQSARWNLNTLLRYPLDKQHALSSELKYVPLTLTAESALGMYEAAGPGILNAALALKSSETSLKLAQMNRLPLPTISFSGIGAQYARYPGGPWEFSNTTTGSASGNFDINGGVMLTLPLVGPGGLFNQRTVSQAYLAKENSRLSYAEAKLSGQSSIISTILSIQQQEKYVANQQETLEKATKLLASLAEDMATSRISRLEMRDALREARNTELDLKNQIQSHLSAKLGLGQTLGSDQFIPEN